MRKRNIRHGRTPNRRREIIRAALACFVERGYTETSMSHIRKRARASTGSIYHHFRSKDRLAAAVYLDGIRSYQEGFLDALEAHDQAREGIRAVIRYHLKWVQENADWARFLFQQRHAEFMGEKEEEFEALNEEFFGRASRWFIVQIEAGNLRRLQPDVLVSLLIGPCQEYARQFLSGRSCSEPEQAAEKLGNAVWRALGAPPEAALEPRENLESEEEAMSEQIWKEAANVSVAAGGVPLPVTETVLEILKTILTEEQAKFIRALTGPMRLEEVQEASDLAPEAAKEMLETLMRNGIVTGIPSRTSGVMVYRLMPPLPGLFEFTMMRGGTSEKEKKLARLFETLFGELSGLVQSNYDGAVEAFKTATPMTRVVPVEREVAADLDEVIPYEDVKGILEKFDTFAVSNCYCRHEKELLDKPCQVTREKENCLFFGQTARFVIDYDFGREATREEVKKILEDCEDAGLVHKTFHTRQDLQKDEFAICNCCKCCCGTFELYYRGAIAAHTYASYVAEVDAEACTRCGECEQKCPMEAVEVLDEGAKIDTPSCIGCGVCAHHCPEEAIHLKRTGIREVFVPPVRQAASDA